MPDILNISCYKFVPLPDAEALRKLLAERAAQHALKGTVLLAEEGINFFLAGPAAAVHAWVDALRSDARFADVQPKESWSEVVPFRKMLVKVKREIIRMDHPTICPANGRAPSVKTVVSYCTGGIRCEKAAILMQEEGIDHVYQLEGGILKYFEETDGTGYDGSCFVFDDRRVVDDSLQKTELLARDGCAPAA